MKRITRSGVRLGTHFAAALALTCAATSSFAAPGWCGSGKTVKLAQITWESGALMTEMVRTVLEKGYGCKTEVIPGATAATETALASNDLQVWAEHWTGRSPIVARALKDGNVKLVGELIPGGDKEGWYVPDYVINGDAKRGIKPIAPQLRSISQLPQYKDLFADDEEPGKGRFYNCPAGWDCERFNNQLLKAYKLGDDYTNFRPGTGGALDAAIASAYERGKPILFYYWQPAGLMAKYHFVQLQGAPYSDACWNTVADPKDTPCASAFKVSHLKIAVSTPFYDTEPGAMAFFEKVSLPLSLDEQMVQQMHDKKLDASRVAHSFFEQHPEIWKQWVTPDVAARVQASLGT
ncbi:ABC transporter substrate-binding protein [Paraburkholderia sartisoli]|uniref:Glycine betaine/proline transport system substrate-binding protein n=1 Tax=Paraburkholderia sartisoli TaxID=83784 RepID=A0A1H4HIP3_9BURK|nr:ABC transporter substrate-binding protein [Paraburkholderia sartisoli]SEB21551.1 glycine betaine/proline transport system substrate-binding protein [Paraburkholderia sartisoli]